MLTFLLQIFNTAIAVPINDTTDAGFEATGKQEINDGSWLVQQGHVQTTWKWEGVTAHVDLLDARVWGSEVSYKTNKDTSPLSMLENVEIALGNVPLVN